ncbi:MAG: hybrid sensor histidine kinase/response regulator [Oscillatoria princeps RMCB-10]|nr:hybrid sensor histidine kinase/response regulator [Oscillatoria princeps RMCB-10]
MDKYSDEMGAILIVDRSPGNLGALFDFLSDFGFQVLIATDGESALKLVEDAAPDLILLDALMPGIDGYETCRRLKANPATEDIPVIFMTVLSETVDKVRGFNLGAVDYITKPVHQEEVLARVTAHLTVRNLQKRLLEKNEELAALNRNLEKLVEEKTKQLINQEKAALIGRLTQGMVHNLRNPIQTILGFSELIEQRAAELDEPSLLKYSGYILGAAAQINQMVNNLMVKVKRDRAVKLKPVDLNELVKYELELLGANMDFKYGVEKEFLFDGSLPTLPLISSHISQVFYNLVSNALDAMWERTERKLTVVTRQDEAFVCIDIHDTGCGIPPDQLQIIFDLFYTTKPAKGEAQQEGQPTGTGLGLPTCLELLKPFGGEIAVTSEVKRGSVFTVVLPKRYSPDPYPHSNAAQARYQFGVL